MTAWRGRGVEFLYWRPYRSVRDPYTSLAGVMATRQRYETGIIKSYSQCNKCGPIVWIMNVLISIGIRFTMNADTNIKSVTRVMAAGFLVLSHSQFAMPTYCFFYSFLLISIMNFHISLSRSRDPSVHLIIGGECCPLRR